MIRNFRHKESGDVYRIDFRKRWRWGHYEMHCVSHPDCPYPMGYAAHLEGDQVSVMGGKEPMTLEQATAIALHWMHGFSTYARTGVFPQGPARVNAAESLTPIIR